MSAKLKLNPDVAYVMGIFAYNKGDAIGLVTKSDDVVAKFVKIVIKEFGIDTTRILITEEEGEQRAYFYNSKLKKLLQRALGRKEVTFKYKNAYSAGYFAGIFDVNGGKDMKGFFIKDMEKSDAFMLDKLGWITRKRGFKTYILSQKGGERFVDFIKEQSEMI